MSLGLGIPGMADKVCMSRPDTKGTGPKHGSMASPE